MKEGTFKKETNPQRILHWATEGYLCEKVPKIGFQRGPEAVSESTLFSSTYVNGEPGKVQSVSTEVAGGRATTCFVPLDERSSNLVFGLTQAAAKIDGRQNE
ncbi:hypothetical protein CBS147332_369 [Penicillium roqueforti]|nr:hypothetical protein CBS147332_369 [Penicillium roqueforti]KAI3120817.1 hypothetical protein CBS147331_2036 [Penicillium roqueforti]